MKIVFMGTPDFAVGILEALDRSDRHIVEAVVTQPDRPKGRGRQIIVTPVKEYALARGYKVYQPQRVKDGDFVDILRRLEPDLIVVAAFGQMLSKEILELPKYGCVNVHASLLPKYRGAAPIQYAIIKGEKESGVTIMQMDVGMDTGAMLGKIAVPIGENTTMGELHDMLRREGAVLLLNVMEEIAAGTVVAVPQNEEEATYAHMLERSTEKIEWRASSKEIHDLIRGLAPVPGAFTILPDGRSLKIFGSRLSDKKGLSSPGTVFEVTKKSFFVACGEGVLEIIEVQPESKKRVAAQVFINGRGVLQGDMLG